MSIDTETRPDTAKAPTLTVEISTTIKVRETLDLVAYFTAFTDRQRERYQTMDIVEFGMDAEWERPLAFLWPDDDLIPYGITSATDARVFGDIDDTDIRVSQRNGGDRVYGRDAHWTEDDFNALVRAVPWMAAVHGPDGPADPEDLARIPGPHDVPLFD